MKCPAFARVVLALLTLGVGAGPAPTLAPKPLYRDPVYDGAADPTLIWDHAGHRWLMFYTNRRANAANLSGVRWVHGTRIGIAESTDGAAHWTYVGTANITFGKPDYTYWAPEVIYSSNLYHMYLSVVPGIFNNWNAPRAIVHLTSHDLKDWQYESTLDLHSDRVIDPCVFRLANGTWRMWFKDERAQDGSIYFADSSDLSHWTAKGVALPGAKGEGPKVFHWKDRYWLVYDAWDGLGVYWSNDCLHWTRQEHNLVKEAGTMPTDRTKGNHPDIVVSADGRAYLFYFTHQVGADAEEKPAGWNRHTVIQVAELWLKNEALTCDRNKAVNIDLLPDRTQ